MTKVKWIKLSVNMFDDEKIKLIKTMPEGDKIIVTWVQLLCLAGKTNDGGLVYMGQNMVYTDEMLATIFDEQVNIIRIAVQALEQLGLIEVKEDGKIDIINWSRHQNIEGLNRIKRQGAERQRLHYYRKKLKEMGVDVTDPELPNTADEIKEYYHGVKKNLTLGSRETNGTEGEEELEGEREVEEEIEAEKEREQEKEQKQAAAADSDIKKVNIFFQNNFGEPNQHIKHNLNEWLEEIGIDLVLEAMKRSAEAQKNYNYAKGIMKNWNKNQIKTLKDVEAQDREYVNSKKQPHKGKQETLPDWAKEDYQAPKDEDEIDGEKKRDQLSRLKKLKEERGIKQ